jgi:hypothetical protein
MGRQGAWHWTSRIASVVPPMNRYQVFPDARSSRSCCRFPCRYTTPFPGVYWRQLATGLKLIPIESNDFFVWMWSDLAAHLSLNDKWKVWSGVNSPVISIQFLPIFPQLHAILCSYAYCKLQHVLWIPACAACVAQHGACQQWKVLWDCSEWVHAIVAASYCSLWTINLKTTTYIAVKEEWIYQLNPSVRKYRAYPLKVSHWTKRSLWRKYVPFYRAITPPN